MSARTVIWIHVHSRPVCESKRASFAAFTLAVVLAFPAAGMAQGSAPESSGDAAAQQFQRQLRALNWTAGPQQVQMFGNSSLQVPKDYLFLGTADAAKLEALEKQLPSGTHYFFAPRDFHWQVLFRYSDDGYVKDGESIDADAILKSIRDSTERGNEQRRSRGYDEVEVTGWQTPPHYDSQTHRLEWAVQGRDLKTNEQIVNFNTRILGRGGVMSVLLITSPDSLTAGITDLKGTLGGFDYLTGQRYAEYKPGDKIAKYGLAALITGGVAAVAVKTGLWKVILGGLVAGWKFVVAGIVALFGGISRFFKRKTV